MEDRLDTLAVDMFKTFARFEYALKAAGFNNGDGDAKPDWGAFARAIDGHFEKIDDKDLKAAVEYVLGHPPKKQVIRNSKLEWDPAKPNTNLRSDLLLTYVRRVRNNLFHGGKFNGHWFEPERSEVLIQHSITILKSCLRVSREVGDAYEH